MGFELCKNPYVVRNCKPQAIIYKDGRMRLNKEVIRRYKLEECKYIRAFFDKEKNLLALEPSAVKQEGSLTFSCHNGFIVKRMMAYFGIDYEKYIGTYNIVKNPGHAFLMIDLDAKVENAKGGRKSNE